MILTSEWAAIKATTHMVKADLFSLPPSQDHRAKEWTKAKVYFQTYFRKEWDAAVAKMESLQSLLALCASHWKAEHILGNMLLVKVAADSEDDDSNSSVDQDNESPRSENRKRPAKRRSHDKKRQKKAQEKSGSVNDEGDGAKSDHVDIGKSLADNLYNNSC